MPSLRPLPRWLGVLLVVGLALGAALAYGVTATPENRAEIVVIDALQAFGSLERPAVLFPHDRHAAVLAKKNQDCSACHLKDGDKLSPKFKRLKDESKGEVRRLYHDNCQGCHRQTTKEKSGPLGCNDCHRGAAGLPPQKPAGLDKDLHQRHVAAKNGQCDDCHHDPGGSCRYCHTKDPQENKLTMRLVAHDQCLNCHLQAQAEKKAAGPVSCVGCHDPQEPFARPKEPARLEAKQPDAALLVAGPKAGRLPAVPFDHKTHEAATESCRVCHHAKLSTCAECHTLAGTKESKGVGLEKAMHQLGTKTSCLGCHEKTQAEPNCAGCHAFGQPGTDLAGCLKCHQAVPGQAGGQEAAAKLIKERKSAALIYPDQDIPETVTIDAVAEKFEPVAMNHRAMAKAMAERIKDSKLAGYFHDGNPGWLCQGCHHNAPATKTPPKCAACHPNSFDPQNPTKPTLRAAYHQNCFGCHEKMGVDIPAATDCTACHAQKKKG